MILGCTHYPLIRKEVELFYKKKIEIIDSATVVAMSVENALKERKLLNPGKTASKLRFFVSDYIDAFEKSTRIFFREKIELEEARIWD